MRPIMLLLACATLLSAALPAFAEGGMTFYIRNETSRAMVLELHGRESGRAWPGSGAVYLLEPGEKKSVLIDCEEEETVCYGAWVNGNDRISYGIGPDANRLCRDCCSVCTTKKTVTIDMPQ